jgi:formylglycine-generating enzyme required for sulfatase activity
VFGIIIYLTTDKNQVTLDFGEPKSTVSATVKQDGRTIGEVTIEPKPPESSVPRKESVGPSADVELVLVPAGLFEMGSPDSDLDADDVEKPRHPVRITRPFYLGVCEVTRGQYRAVTGETPSYFEGSDDLPVERVSWWDAVKFCNQLSRARSLPPFYGVNGETVTVLDWSATGYRLPTEAEWEYACRAGSAARYSFGNDPGNLRDYAWHKQNSKGKTHPVRQKRPNAWGLFDMNGNVWEWCWDAYDGDYYATSARDDPRGPRSGRLRVRRGASFVLGPSDQRSAFRERYDWGFGNGNDVGFRVARSTPSKPPTSSAVLLDPVETQPVPLSPPAPKRAAQAPRVVRSVCEREQGRQLF